MKKVIHLLSLCLFLCAFSTNLQAQSDEINKMTITIQKTDMDGNESTQTIVKMGNDASPENAQAIVDEMVGDFEGEVEVDVDIQRFDADHAIEMDGNEVEMEVSVDEEGNVFINGEQVEEGEYEDENIIIIKADDSDGLGNVQDMLIEMDIDVNIEEMIENIDAEGAEKEIRIIKKTKSSECKKDKGGFLGVYAEKYEGTTGGVLIDKVIEGSAAEKAGLQKGDVIKTINGNPINSHMDLVKAISTHKAKETIQVGYSRAGNPMSQAVVLGERTRQERVRVQRWGDGNTWMQEGGKMDCSKMSKEECKKICESMSKEECMKMCEGMTAEDCIRICGFDCSKNSKSAKPRMGVIIEETNGSKGVLVEEISVGSPAEKAGLQANDIITKVNKTKVNSVNELIQAVRANQVGDEVKVQYLRNGKKQKSKLTLDAAPQKKRFYGGCCSKGNNTLESITEQRIIIKTIDENGNIVEEVIDGNELMDMPTKNTLDLETIDLYPNPTNGNISVQFQTSEKAATAVRIFDATGKEVYASELPNFDGNFNETVDLKGNQDGIYFLTINQGGKVFTEKVILKN